MKHTVELIELKSGAKGLFIDVPDSSVVLFDLNFRAGDYLSPNEKWDTAHVMEHLVLGANARYKKSRDYSREFSKNGAYNNASTGTYHMSYIAECAEFETERILDLLCLAVESPLFLQEEFNAEVANVREELKSRRNNHSWELSLRAGQAMGMLDMPYTEREKQLHNITLNDVQNHYKKTHVLPNLRFYIAGAVKPHKKAILERLESIDLPTDGERIALPSEPLHNVSEPILIPDTAVDNVYYRWETAFDGLLSDTETEHLDALLGTLLSTMHSRIFGTARERGLVYGIGYGKYRTRDNHLWTIHGEVLPQNIEPLFTLITSELRSVADGNFSEAEMEETRQYALGNFQRGYQTVGSVLDAHLEKFNFDEKIEDITQFEKQVKAVQAKDIIAIARKALKQELSSSLSFYGAVNEIDVTKLQDIIKATYR
jgi:predicted Zn-dependent peptidase